MNKFTIFTIIFSAIVVITVGELVVNDYLDRHGETADSKNQIAEEELVVEDVPLEEPEVVADTIKEVAPNLASFDYISFGFAEDTEGEYKPSYVRKILRRCSLEGAAHSDALFVIV